MTGTFPFRLTRPGLPEIRNARHRNLAAKTRRRADAQTRRGCCSLSQKRSFTQMVIAACKIYQRPNGTFGFDEWTYGAEEQSWFLGSN
jgi:hypothetical protein